MKKFLRHGGAMLCAASLSALSTPALAQDAAPSAAETSTSTAPIVAHPVEAAQFALPANTEITLSMNQELSSRRSREHDTFNLTVVSDVRLGDYVVIPAGTRAVGEITWMTGRGMFGKSGKMDIALRYVDLNGRQIPLEGTFRQEGEGNTVATVAAVVLVAPVVGFFITGHSAVIPAGRQLTGRTREALAVSLPANAIINDSVRASLAPAPQAEAAPASQAEAAPAEMATAEATPADAPAASGTPQSE